MENTDLTHSTEARSSWLDTPLFRSFKLNLETLIFILLLVAAVFSRFYLLEERVMSHDETSHVYFSWLLSQGNGYAHDPITHGPFQFHIVALSYFLFGDSDLTARIPVALFSIATIAFAWYFRRYLGRYGGLVAILLLLISPYMLYYGRYVRNEAFVGFYGVITLFTILRYLETGRDRYLYWLTAMMVMHFATKETSFIYMAQALLFLGLLFVYRLATRPWKVQEARSRFLILFILAIFLVVGSIGASQVDKRLSAAQPVPLPTAVSETATPEVVTSVIPSFVIDGLLVLGAICLLGAAIIAVTGYSFEQLKSERSWDLLILLGTLVLPQLSPFVINFIGRSFVGWKIPVNATEVNALALPDILRMASVLVPISLLSVGIGLWWDRRRWLISAGIWYSIFTVLFTTLFTNGAGFITGMVGSLGYWLAQQEVNRGSQPWYYYAALQIPIYEYLPALGSILAAIFFFWRPRIDEIRQAAYQKYFNPESQDQDVQYPPVFPLLAFWSLTSLFAYSLAGEKMPWLTVHIALPMILLSAWFFGYILESLDWERLRERYSWLAFIILPVFLIALGVVMASLLGSNPPFQGQSLQQLANTSTFLFALISAIASGYALVYLLRGWSFAQSARLVLLVFFGLLALLTGRAAFMASYINYDYPTEYLVYAHSGSGNKQALNQIEDISRRLTGTLDVVIAYDNDTTYPFWWYLRNYPKARFYGSAPTRDLRDAPLILVGDTNYGKIEPVVGQAYHRFDYIRIWWPDQDYYYLTWERVWNAFSTPEWRNALFQIWFYRDYSAYAQLVGKDMSLTSWQPSGSMRLYIRKDVAATLWNFGAAPAEQELLADPYEGKGITLTADLQIGSVQSEFPGLFSKPRNLAVAPDGTLYVADTGNHRIQHLQTDGTLIHSWGSFADISKGQAPGSTFYEPWGIAVAPDGSVFVADTWNHRIQKFGADGEFITMWGYFGQGERPEGFWGPRSVVVDEQGRVFVSDTGNKRIVIFDSQGNFINQFGVTGMQPGEFNEPTGLALAPDGTLYVADTWNQRIQSFTPTTDGSYEPALAWEIVGWYGQSLDNKPYLAVGSNGNVFTSDPEGSRILEFTAKGEFVRYWGDFGAGTDGLNLPIGLAVDPEGGIWVADSGNNRLVHYTLP